MSDLHSPICVTLLMTSPRWQPSPTRMPLRSGNVAAGSTKSEVAMIVGGHEQINTHVEVAVHKTDVRFGGIGAHARENIVLLQPSRVSLIGLARRHVTKLVRLRNLETEIKQRVPVEADALLPVLLRAQLASPTTSVIKNLGRCNNSARNVDIASDLEASGDCLKRGQRFLRHIDRNAPLHRARLTSSKNTRSLDDLLLGNQVISATFAGG